MAVLSPSDWLSDSETFSVGYFDAEAENWDGLAESKVTFTTHCPINGKFFERCHILGIRCFPYVTFYLGSNEVLYPSGLGSKKYQGVILKAHPQFKEVDDQGDFKPSVFGVDGVNVSLNDPWIMCPNVKEYQDAMAEWVEAIMKLGADGIFLDNIFPREACHGPHFSRHKHVSGGLVGSSVQQNTAFSKLLSRAHSIIKKHKPEGAILGNTSGNLPLPPDFWNYLEAGMLESYVCVGADPSFTGDWAAAHGQGTTISNLVPKGKSMLALSNLPFTPASSTLGIREDAFICYATARLAGFVWNGGKAIAYGPPAGPGNSTSLPYADDLFRLHLGGPLTDELSENGVFYRIFEAGLVAVNPTVSAQQITVGNPIPTPLLFDVFIRSPRTIRNTTETGGKLEIPAESGRVYLFVTGTDRELI